MEASKSGEEPNEGILLYYHYTDLSQVQHETAAWMQQLCQQLGLRGRVRVALDGVNATLGGGMEQLQQHIAAASSRFSPSIDFKLCPNPGARNECTHKETGFSQMNVKMCKELVTLGHLAQGRADPWVNTGVHLSPQQFHNMLLSATRSDHVSSAATEGSRETPTSTRDAALAREKELVLLDVRNMYETSIGHFCAEGVDFLDPCTRQFSDLPAFLDRELSKLANKRVLMYCTGGVRCERASAYLREKGQEWSDVYQLQGGIQRYLEAFPDGGLFKGKNFVYDERVAVSAPMQARGPGSSTCAAAASTPPTTGTAAVGSAAAEAAGRSCSSDGSSSAAAAASTSTPMAGAAAVVGRCLVCRCPWDDYGNRCRCRLCRQLVLVCPSCSANPAAMSSLQCSLCTMRKGSRHISSTGSQLSTHTKAGHASDSVGEACLGARQERAGPCEQANSCQEQEQHQHHHLHQHHHHQGVEAAAPGAKPRRLRILCLHGFRQTAANFEGRTNAFRRKLQDIAEFVFVNAPHQLPLFYKPRQDAGAVHGDTGEHSSQEVPQSQQQCLDRSEAQQQQHHLHCHHHHHHQQQQEKQACYDQPEAQQQQSQIGSALQPIVLAPPSKNSSDSATQAPVVKAEGCRVSQKGGCNIPIPPPHLRKRAWLLQPELLQRQPKQQISGSSPQASPAELAGQASWDQWEPAPDFVSEQQHLTQTAGWEGTWQLLQRVMMEQGPFDGVLGFSQGAGIAAALCALQQQSQGREQHPQHPAAERRHQTGQPANPPSTAEAHHDQQQQCQHPLLCLRFAIMVSGYAPSAPELQHLLQTSRPLRVPSLHLLGSADRQVSREESEELAVLFDISCRNYLVHNAAHVLPATQKPVNAVRQFLQQFLF